MATTQTYKCTTNNAPIKSKSSLFSPNLGTLKKDALIEVISISGSWAYFKYNNKDAYILTMYIQKVPTVVTGSVTLKYLNTDTKAQIAPPVTNSNLPLKSYTYTAISIANYTVVEPSTASVTLTAANPNQEVIFYYKENKIYGSVTIQYVEKGTNMPLAPSETYTNIELGTYSYNSIDIPGYKLSGVSSQSVTLTKDTYNQTIIFEYIKILGTVYVKHLDVDTKIEMAPTESYSNLELKSYSYSAKSIDGYTVVEPSSKTITLTSTDSTQNVVFYYKANKIYGSVTINYIDKSTNTSIAPAVTNNNLELGTYSYSSIDITGYQISGTSSKSVTLTKEIPNQNITFEYTLIENINMDQPPYIATRYLNHTFDINEDVIINFYVTDWNQSDVIEENTDTQFDIEIKLNNTSKKYTKYIGENTINIGKLTSGEYELLLQATDEFGRKSHELYNEFRVIDKIKYNDIITKNTHIITDSELSTYNISKNNDVTNALNTKIGIQNLINDLAKSGVRKAILPLGTYRILPEFKWSPGNQIQYVKDPISIPSNFILDLNGSMFKQATTSYEQQKGLMIAFDHAYDSHVINGIIEGDYGDRDLTPLPNGNPAGEHLACGSIAGKSRYCSFENLTIKKFCGYAMVAGLSPSGLHSITQGISSWLQGDINTNGNLDLSISGKYTSDFIDLSKFKDVNTIRTGRYLGYLFNPDGDSWIVKYHFYDSSKQYISTTTGHQYRDIRKPSNAAYLRCTYITTNLTSLSQVMVMYYYFPRNCNFNNITFEDTRTCALAPFQGNNILIDNCTFARCATNITPVAVDFEDGWHNMQDYCMQNCEILVPAGTGDLVIVGGLDLIFRNNINWRISSRGCSRGQVFTNNKLPYTNLGLSSHILSAFTIFKNNTILGYVGNGLGKLSDIKLVIDNCTFDKIGYQNYDEKIIVRDCTLNWNNKVLQNAAPVIGGSFLRCIFNDFNAGNIHIKDLQLTNCTINNMNMFLQGKFILNHCNVNKCTLTNYTVDINIDLNNGCIINDFNFNRTSWANCNIIFKSSQSTFNNSTTKNIIGDSFSSFGNIKTFTVITNGILYLNNTVLATSKVLSNPNIDFSNAK